MLQVFLDIASTVVELPSKTLTKHSNSALYLNMIFPPSDSSIIIITGIHSQLEILTSSLSITYSVKLLLVTPYCLDASQRNSVVLSKYPIPSEDISSVLHLDFTEEFQISPI